MNIQKQLYEAFRSKIINIDKSIEILLENNDLSQREDAIGLLRKSIENLALYNILLKNDDDIREYFDSQDAIQKTVDFRILIKHIRLKCFEIGSDRDSSLFAEYRNMIEKIKTSVSYDAMFAELSSYTIHLDIATQRDNKHRLSENEIDQELITEFVNRAIEIDSDIRIFNNIESHGWYADEYDKFSAERILKKDRYKLANMIEVLSKESIFPNDSNAIYEIYALGNINIHAGLYNAKFLNGVADGDYVRAVSQNNIKFIDKLYLNKFGAPIGI